MKPGKVTLKSNEEGTEMMRKMQEDARTKILSRPTIVTHSGKRAAIMSGEGTNAPEAGKPPVPIRSTTFEIVPTFKAGAIEMDSTVKLTFPRPEEPGTQTRAVTAHFTVGPNQTAIFGRLQDESDQSEIIVFATPRQIEPTAASGASAAESTENPVLPGLEPAAADGPMITKEWPVPAFVFRGKDGSPQDLRIATVKEVLAAEGVSFPPGSSGVWLPGSSKLVVRNTQENLDRVDTFIARVAAAAPAGEWDKAIEAAKMPTTEAQAAPVQATPEGLAAIVIPLLEFHELTLPEAVKFLNEKAREADPKKAGVNVFLSPEVEEQAGDSRITMTLKNIPLKEAVRYIAGLSNLASERTLEGFKLVPRTEPPVPVPPRSISPVPVEKPSASIQDVPPQPQEPTKVASTFFDPAVPIKINAEETRFEKGTLVAKENVTFKHKEVTIHAQTLSYVPETRTVHAWGTVKFTSPDREVETEELELDLNSGKFKVPGPGKLLMFPEPEVPKGTGSAK